MAKKVVINGLTVKVPNEAEVELNSEHYLPSIHVIAYRGVYQIIAHDFKKGTVAFSMALGSQDRADIVNHSLDKTVTDSATLQKLVDAAEFLLS